MLLFHVNLFRVLVRRDFYMIYLEFYLYFIIKLNYFKKIMLPIFV